MLNNKSLHHHSVGRSVESIDRFAGYDLVVAGAGYLIWRKRQQDMSSPLAA